MTEIWGHVKESLSRILEADDFNNWIAQVDLKTIDGGILVLEAPTKFCGEWVTRTYGDQILRSVRQLEPTIVDIDFVVRRAPADDRDRFRSGQLIRPSTSPGLPGTPLIKRFTFSEFVVGKSNAVAHAAAVRVAQEDRTTFNPVFLYGKVGMGKTHLMHAIGWALKVRDPDLKIIYLSAEQFMHQFIKALRTQSIMDFKEVFRSVNLLMVDDVQFIAGKESTQEEFFHTFNSLVAQEKQIVLSADKSPGKLAGLESRIRSRLQSGLVVELHPADYELRLGILEQKARAATTARNDLVFRSGVLEFLARRISSNVRVLEGALNRLVAAHSYLGAPITTELARSELADLLRDSDRWTGVPEIIRCVADYYNIKPTEIVGKRRTGSIVRPRQVAIYLAKSLTTKSFPDIGREFNRDHTTVMHSIKRVETLMLEDAALAEDLEIIRRRLEA